MMNYDWWGLFAVLFFALYGAYFVLYDIVNFIWDVIVCYKEKQIEKDLECKKNET